MLRLGFKIKIFVNSERKEKSENDFKEWNQRPTGNWADDMESNEWNPQSSAQGDGTFYSLFFFFFAF